MLDDLLSRLSFVRRVSGGYRALCPVHAEHTPSLSIREIDGAVAAHCFGCGAGTRAVFSAVGLPWAGGSSEPCSPFGLAVALGRQQEGHRLREAMRAVDYARRLDRCAADLRTVATSLGDGPDAWEILETAAALERDAWSIAP